VLALTSIPVTDRTCALDGSRHTSSPPSSGEAGAAEPSDAEDEDDDAADDDDGDEDEDEQPASATAATAHGTSRDDRRRGLTGTR
jgi:hypothetical protein